MVTRLLALECRKERVRRMKIIKRNGAEEIFDINKIVNAIKKANHEVAGLDKLSDEDIREVSVQVEHSCLNMSHCPSVE